MTADPKSPVVSQPVDVPSHPQPGSGSPDSDPNHSSTASGPGIFGLWMHRLNALTFIFLCGVLGVLLVLIPWWPQWTDNDLLLRFPQLREIMASGFFRGFCSGFGILDIWIGFWHAVHYHEDMPS